MLKVEAELIARWLIAQPRKSDAYDASCIMLTQVIDQGHLTEDEVRRLLRESQDPRDAEGT